MGQLKIENPESPQDDEKHNKHTTHIRDIQRAVGSTCSLYNMITLFH